MDQSLPCDNRPLVDSFRLRALHAYAILNGGLSEIGGFRN